jgi:hypothetical protein
MEAGIDHGGILVHCFGGKSRSPAFICAYLMSSCSWSFDAAYNVVKAARPSADINIGFECQLRAYEAARYDVYIAQQLLLRARIRDLHLLKGDKSLIGGQFVPILPPSQSHKDNVTSDSAALSNSSAVPVSVPMFLSAKQQRFDSVSAAEHWQLDSRNPPSAGPNSGQKRALDRGRSALGAGMRADSSTEEAASSSMDVDNHTDGEESSVYRSPLGKAPSRNLQDDSAGNNKALKIDDRSSPSTVMVLDTQSHRHAPLSLGGNSTALEDSVDSQMSKDSTDNNSIVSMSSAPKPYIQPSLSSIPPSSASYPASNDFVQSLSTVPVNFHTGSGGSGGKTSRHRRGGGGGHHSNNHNHGGGGGHSNSSHSSHGSHHHHQNLKSANKNPSCRLSRPGSNWVRVIPPLRGLEREFKCAWCNCVLFQLSSVLRQDINVVGMIDEYLHARQQCFLRQLTTDPALREDPEEQFLKSRSSSSSSGGGSSGSGGSKEKFNDTLMAALKKSTSTLRLAQMHTSPSSSSAAAAHAQPMMLQESHFLPPISSGGGCFVSASAPVSVARHPVTNQRSHSRGFHEPSTAMDVGDDDEDDEAGFPSYPMPLMTTRHAKSQAKGFDFADSPPSSSSSSHHGTDAVPPSLSLSKPTSFGRNHQGNNSFNNTSNNNSSSNAAQSQNRSFRGFGDSPSGSASAPAPSSAEKLFTPRQTSQSHLFPSSSTVAGPATTLLPPPSTTTLSLSSGSGSTHSSPRIPVYSNNTTNMLLPSISVQQSSSSLYPIPSGGGSSGSESTPPPTLHTLSTGSLDGRSQSSSPRIPGIVLTSTSERQPSHNQMISASSSSSSGGNGGGSGRLLPRISPRNLPALENTNGDRPNSAGSNHGPSSAPATTTFRRELMPMTAMAPYASPSLGPRSAQNPHGYDESPRVILPPAKMFDGWSAHDRPRSAEKLRWYARANLLKEGDTRVASIAEADDVASQLAFDKDPYFHVEYLEWMGKELFGSGHEYDHGELCCPGCRHVVGSWTWTPSVRLTRNGTLEAPLFRISKSIVHHTDLDFDATPSATPRLSEDMSL